MLEAEYSIPQKSFFCDAVTKAGANKSIPQLCLDLRTVVRWPALFRAFSAPGSRLATTYSFRKYFRMLGCFPRGKRRGTKRGGTPHFARTHPANEMCACCLANCNSGQFCREPTGERSLLAIGFCRPSGALCCSFPTPGLEPGAIGFAPLRGSVDQQHLHRQNRVPFTPG
jgi:hypothetical protein